MPLPADNINRCGVAASDFASTHWSVVRQAGKERSPATAAALEKLCRTYWYPLYAFVRRQGHDAPTAQDLTQEFFSRLLTANGLESVDHSKGKFRSFLLASMKNLLANEWHRTQAQKRGGGQVHFSLDAVAAEDRYRLDPPDEFTPEKIFDRRWTETVIDAVTQKLQEEFAGPGCRAGSRNSKSSCWPTTNHRPTRRWRGGWNCPRAPRAPPFTGCASATGSCFAPRSRRQ